MRQKTEYGTVFFFYISFMQNLQSHNIVKHCLCTNSEYNNCDIYMALKIDNSNSK